MRKSFAYVDTFTVETQEESHGRHIGSVELHAISRVYLGVVTNLFVIMRVNSELP